MITSRSVRCTYYANVLLWLVIQLVSKAEGQSSGITSVNNEGWIDGIAVTTLNSFMAPLDTIGETRVESSTG